MRSTSHHRGSEASVSSIGMSTGAVVPTPGSSLDEFRSNLLAEGHSEHGKLSDVTQYLLICEEHDRIAISPLANTGGILWIPFAFREPEHTWEQAAEHGLSYFFGKRNDLDTANGDQAEKDQNRPGMPKYTINILQLLRVQLPSGKWITRMTYCVRLSKTGGFTCCRATHNLQWVDKAAVLKDQSIPGLLAIWSPEVKLHIQRLTSKDPRYIFEMSIENSMSYFNRLDQKNSVQGKLLKETKVQEKVAISLYADFLKHCYPAFFMAEESFKRYLRQYGPISNNINISQLYRAACFKEQSYMDWYEFLFAIICLDPSTKPHEARHRLIARYYSATLSNGNVHLTRDNFTAMAKSAGVPIEKFCCGAKFQNDTLSVFEFARWARDNKIAQVGLDKLCRLPNSILATLMDAEIHKIEKLDQSYAANKQDQVCQPNLCQMHSKSAFSFSLHSLRISNDGLSGEPVRTANKAEVTFNEQDLVNQDRYSAEYRFGAGSVSTIILKEVCSNELPFQTTDSSDQWLEYLKHLFDSIKDFFAVESRLMKINLPAVVVGQVLGSLTSVSTIQSMFCPILPVFTSNIIFLGNYIAEEAATSFQVLCYLYALKLQAPDKIILLRGYNENFQEAIKILGPQCRKLFGNQQGDRLFDLIAQTLDTMPFAVILNDSIFCAHSGLPTDKSLKLITEIPTILRNVEDCPIAYELISKEPTSKDASSKHFSKADCESFLQVNQLTNIIRSNGNAAVLGGERDYDDMCLTIASSNTATPTVCYVDPGKKLYCDMLEDIPPSIQFIVLESNSS